MDARTTLRAAAPPLTTRGAGATILTYLALVARVAALAIAVGTVLYGTKTTITLAV